MDNRTAAKVDEQSKNNVKVKPQPVKPQPASVSTVVIPHQNNTHTTYVGSTRAMTRPISQLKPILSAMQAPKKIAPMSALARAKAKRERMLAKMNDYSKPAPEVIERAKQEERRAHGAPNPPLLRPDITEEGPQTNDADTFTLEIRPSPPSVNRGWLPVPKAEREKRVNHFRKSEKRYLRSLKPEDPHKNDKRRNPQLKEHYKDKDDSDSDENCDEDDDELSWY